VSDECKRLFHRGDVVNVSWCVVLLAGEQLSKLGYLGGDGSSRAQMACCLRGVSVSWLVQSRISARSSPIWMCRAVTSRKTAPGSSTANRVSAPLPCRSFSRRTHHSLRQCGKRH
jgi:hypothetical protein